MRAVPLVVLLFLQDADVVKRALPEDAEIRTSKRAVNVERARAILGTDVAAEIEVFEADGPHAHSASERPHWTATVIPIETPYGPARLAVSVLLDEDKVGRVRIGGIPDKHVPMEFLRQFGGYAYSSASLEEPAATLAAARAKASDGKDEEAAVLRALINVRTAMSRITPLNLAIVDRIQKKQRKAEEADALFKAYDDVSRAADALPFLKADARKRLKDLASASAGHARTVAASIRSGDFAAADKAQQTVSSSCGACHGSFLGVFRPERARRKIGDGYFEIGYDVLAQPDADAKLMQAIAAGVRRAVVLLRP